MTEQPSQGDATLAQPALPGDVELSCRLERSAERVVVRAVIRNQYGGPIYVFDVEPPFVRLDRGRASLTSAMPVIPPWTKPFLPHVPPVRELEHGASLELRGEYELPLRERHPYPLRPLTSTPETLLEESITSLSMTVGFFPRVDGNELHARRDGRMAPGYYNLVRQLLATVTIATPPIKVLRPDQ